MRSIWVKKWQAALAAGLSVAAFASVQAKDVKRPAALPATELPNVSVQIVMDASGSMNGKLADGARKISAARSAIQTMVSTLPDSYMLSLRAYGHQSRPSAKNCQDTEMLVRPGSGAPGKDRIIDKMRKVQAQGYTPISLSLRRASEDLETAGPAHRVIILVSDGRERCEGDPCATARRLVGIDNRLTIHTVGFAVGTVARSELRCVARVAGGQYFDAQDASELSQKLASVPTILASLPTSEPSSDPSMVTPVPKPPSGQVGASSPRVIVVNRDQPGRLTVEPAGSIHRIMDPDTNEIVAAIGASKKTVSLPAGTYNVTFGNGLWRSVEVKPRELTRLQPATIEVVGASLLGHEVVDTETGEVLAKLTASEPRAVLIPTVVGVKFGPVVWPDIALEEGEKRVIEPGVLTVRGAGKQGHVLRTNNETVVSRLTIGKPTIPLPPGNYSLQVSAKRIPFAVRAGERLIVEVK